MDGCALKSILRPRRRNGLAMSSELLKVAVQVLRGGREPLVMPDLRHSPISRKLTVMNVLVSAVALIAACAAFLAYDQYTFRQNSGAQSLGRGADRRLQQRFRA